MSDNEIDQQVQELGVRMVPLLQRRISYAIKAVVTYLLMTCIFTALNIWLQDGIVAKLVAAGFFLITGLFVIYEQLKDIAKCRQLLERIRETT